VIDLDTLEAAASFVHRVVPPTPQYCWPLLSRRLGAELWVKHENHTPIGSFKIRGGLVYLDAVRRSQPDIRGVVTATTGNHGQSIALAAARLGVDATIVVPYGNSIEKNRAMVGFGARLVEAGHDFQAAFEHATELAEREKRHFVHSYDPLLVRGVASYALELFRAVPDLDVVYVPIGLGSGISGVIAARDALRLRAEIVGVVAANAPTYALSFAAGTPVSTNSADTMAGGLAVRVPDPEALDIIRRGAARIGSRNAPRDADHVQRHPQRRRGRRSRGPRRRATGTRSPRRQARRRHTIRRQYRPRPLRRSAGGRRAQLTDRWATGCVLRDAAGGASSG